MQSQVQSSFVLKICQCLATLQAPQHYYKTLENLYSLVTRGVPELHHFKRIAFFKITNHIMLH